MSCLKRICSRKSDDGGDDDSDDKDSKRKSRNLSEKKRRDQFNLLVNELNTMVSTIGGRKMDKSTVLKATISFLKNHNEVAVRSRVHEIQENWKPNFLTNEEFTHLILEAVDGFLVVFGSAGNILYISESITSLLGYLPDDILGMTIYDLGCTEEQNDLYNILTGPVSEDDRPVSFSCHLRRANYDQKYTATYDLVHFVGYFRTDNETDSSRYSAYSGDADSRLVFIGTGRLQVPHLINEMRLVDPTAKSEFTSRHSLEWKFLHLDHRAPPIIGYLPFELLGTSGYDYYHIDDMDRVVCCHDALMQKGEGTSCYYRFLTKGQQWIWLQTRFYITYHQWNSKPEFIVCTHRVISHVDVLKNITKDAHHGNSASLGESSPLADYSSSAVPWYSRGSASCHSTGRHQRHHHGRHKQSYQHHQPEGQSSDCTSIMSADSAISRRSCVTPLSTKSKASRSLPANNHQPSQSGQTSLVITHVQLPLLTATAAVTFDEPTQFVAAIAVQPNANVTELPSFSDAASVTSQIPNVEDFGLGHQVQTQMQADLQRKHAELQALIGHQQAELRRVSEQLLMARLGILQPQQPQANAEVSSHSAGTVSSTTSVSPAVQSSSASSAAIVTQSNDVYNSPNPDE